MCDVISMIGTALAAVGSVAETSAYNKQADANAKAANANLTNQYNQINKRKIQETNAAATEKEDIARQARKDRATATVAAGESGVSGLSVDALISDVYGQEATAKDRIDQNLDMSIGQLNANQESAKASAQSQINSMPKKSYLGSVLKIGTSGLSSWQKAQSAT